MPFCIKLTLRRPLFACIFAFAAGCESNAEAQPSLLPSLAELRPAIFCIDAATDKNGVRDCLMKQGITSDYRYPDQPSSREDFKRQTLLMWATLGRGGAAHLSSSHFASAMEYASCIERATNALERLEGERKKAIGLGMAKAEVSCASQPLSVQSVAKRHPSLLNGQTSDQAMEEMKAFFLARTFASAVYRYVIESYGWVTDEMRPCVRYLDGRPPSVGCAGETKLPAPAPPPGYQPK